MSGYKRILVYLEHKCGTIKLAQFTDCILSSLNIENNAGLVNCSLRENKLVLSSSTSPIEAIKDHHPQPILLTHPPFCPIKCLRPSQAQNLPPEILNRGVDVGVVVLLETNDENILLTRRAKHMRTFPGIWVPPGGHIEKDESLLEAGLRELHEETGLDIVDNIRNERVLCLWESVYPYMLSMGLPKRHHVVVYLNIKVSVSKSILMEKMRLDKEEVDAGMWLDPVLCRLVADDKVPDICPPQIQVLELDHQGRQKINLIKSSFMTNSAPESGEDIERVSTGTRYALAQWLLQKS